MRREIVKELRQAIRSLSGELGDMEVTFNKMSQAASVLNNEESYRHLEDAEKDVQERRRELKSLMDDFGDRLDLDIFQAKKISDYFNEKAKSRPETEQKSLALSGLFAAAASASREEHEGWSLTIQEEQAILQAESAVENLKNDKNEWNAINKYVFSRIDEFVTENPTRWQRIEKNLPALVKDIHQFRK